MNTQTLSFCLVRYQPDMQRQEIVNVGIVLFSAAGPLVSFAASQGKLLALDPNYQITRLFDKAKRLQDALRGLSKENASVEEMVAMFSAGGGLSLSPPGLIDSQAQSSEEIIEELQRDLVSPPSRKQSRSRPTSRLHTELRQMFREAKILGSKPGDISRHLVVPNYPIDADIGLFAEFALRNGRLHVTETVDFRTGTASSKKQEAQAKTLLLVEAAERVGSNDLRRYVVVTGASAQVQSSMNLLERYSDEIIVRESEQDWRRYVDAMYNAARPNRLPLQ